MKPRPDSPAILGLIAVAALIVVGWVVLTVAGKSTPAEAWIALSTVVGVVGGWVGKTLTTEPAPEVAPEPVDPVMVVAEPQTWAAPVVQDRAEREAISEFLADPPQPELVDDADR